MHEHHRDRLRSKLVSAPDSLTDHEILELLLFNAIPRKNTNDVAHRLIDEFGDLKSVFNAPAEALTGVEGVGLSTACFLNSIGIIMRRVKGSPDAFPKFVDFGAVRSSLIKAFSSLPKEAVIIFYLDRYNSVVSQKIIYSKSATEVDINLKDLTRQVALIKPVSVAIAHNHPAGTPRPSLSDDAATEKICMLLSLGGVELIDHFIVAGEEVYSYHHSGRLDAIKLNVEEKLK